MKPGLEVPPYDSCLRAQSTLPRFNYRNHGCGFSESHIISRSAPSPRQSDTASRLSLVALNRGCPGPSLANCERQVRRFAQTQRSGKSRNCASIHPLSDKEERNAVPRWGERGWHREARLIQIPSNVSTRGLGYHRLQKSIRRGWILLPVTRHHAEETLPDTRTER